MAFWEAADAARDKNPPYRASWNPTAWREFPSDGSGIFRDRSGQRRVEGAELDAKLILFADDGRSGEYKLKLPVIMGRSRQAGLTVLHSSVSRQHCELTEYEGQLVVNDLGSLNGTFIEETRIAEPTILPDGGLLRVGSVRFQAVYEADDHLAPPTVPAPKASASLTPISHSTAEGLLPPGAHGIDPMSPAGAGEALHGPPETEPLETAAKGEEDLELIFDEDSGGEGPADAPLEFLTLDKPPIAAAKTPAPVPAPRKVPTPAPAPAATKTPAPPKPAAPEEQTINFIPGAPEAQPQSEALADDLDSFFKSLQ